MPGWHDQTKELVDEGQLKVVGLVQEQHPDRAVLFMQWQEMDWPVFSDPFNDLGISAVPITLLIDQYGIIRFRNPDPEDLRMFLRTAYANDAKKQALPRLPKSIEALETLIEKEPGNARAHFRLGVAYRHRFDSANGRPEDFARGVRHWQTALALNPNQYIWRRRIQQYGPRLDKPYSFYDWVATARKEIRAAGGKPHPLEAEPSGAEFAIPMREESPAAIGPTGHPDPKKEITPDTAGLVASRVVLVPSTDRGRPAVRVHLTLVPAAQTTWDNEAGPVSFHLDPEVPVELRDLTLPDLPEAPSSHETRVLEFELHPKPGKKFPEKLAGAVFYYVCTKTDHTCRFLRQDIVLEPGK